MNNGKLSHLVRTCAIALVGVGGLLSVGCDKPAPTSTTAPAAEPAKAAAPSIAIVDLDKVGSDIGWNEQIKRDNETAQVELKRQLEAYVKEISDKLSDRKANIAKAAKLNPQQTEDLNKNTNLDKLPLNKEQLNELGTLLQIAQQYAQNAQYIANQTLQGRMREILNNYATRTRPIVRAVAESQGILVVITKNDSLFHFDKKVDITDRITDEVRKNPPANLNPPPIPTMQLPPINLGEVPKNPATAPASTQPAK